MNVSNVDKVYSFVLEAQTCVPAEGLGIIKKDVTLSVISFYSIFTGKANVKDVSELKNIVEIKNKGERGGIGGIAIDSNGKEYKLADYLSADYKEW